MAGLPFNTYLAAVGPLRAVLCIPNRVTYGNQALEIATALAVARRERAPLFLAGRGWTVNDTLFDIESDRVRIIPQASRVAPLLRLTALALAAGRRARTMVDDASFAVYGTVVRGLWASFSSDLAHDLMRTKEQKARRKRIRTRFQTIFDARKARERAVDRRYYQRRLLREPIPIRLTRRRERQAVDAAGRAGIDPNARIVTLHVREPGYKLGREMQDVKPERKRDDSTRNARVEDYFDAVDFLVGRGYTVVRIGDPTMTPVRRAGVVDLATSPARLPLLETWCLLRSHFLIGTESGPVAVCYLTNTPSLVTNATDPISSYPLRDSFLLLLKHVVDKRTGRELSVEELLGDEHLLNLRDTRRFAYVDNRPEELLAGVREMLALLEDRTAETRDQAEFRQGVERAAARLARRSKFVRKWGADDGFMGDGRIARAFVERLAQPAERMAVGPSRC